MKTPSPTESDTSESLVTTIVEEVADREGVAPTDLTPSLHTVINADALTALFSPTNRGLSREGGRVEFEYCGYDVIVQEDGRVDVSAGEEPGSSTVEENAVN